MIKSVFDFFPRERNAGFRSEPGQRVKDEFCAVHADDGSLYLEKIGETNLYEYIQSFAASTDINVIIKRFAAGDTSVLSQRQGMFFDATQIQPKTYAEVLNLAIAGENAFNALPLEEREKYHNSYLTWLEHYAPLGASTTEPKASAPDAGVRPVQIVDGAAPSSAGASSTTINDNSAGAN